MATAKCLHRSHPLWTIVQLAVGLLFVKLLASILIEYRWYFPADFDNAAFLIGRRDTFTGVYRAAFYVHILSGPLALLLGSFLMLSGTRSRYRALHRLAGKVQLLLILALVVPTGLVMAQQAYAGPIAAAGFSLLAVATGSSVVLAGYFAMKRKLAAHQRWATRCFILLASPLLLRLIVGAAIVLNLESDLFYMLNAWLSWLLPMAVNEARWYLPQRWILFPTLQQTDRALGMGVDS